MTNPTMRQVVAAIRVPTTFKQLLGFKRFRGIDAQALHDVIVDAKGEGYLVEVWEVDGKWYLERTAVGSDLFKKG